MLPTRRPRCPGTLVPALTLFALSTAATAGAGLAPQLDKTFLPDTIGPGSVSTLRFEVVNPDPVSPVMDVAFTDGLPAGVVIATPAGAVTSCGGTLSAPAGGGTIDLTGGAVAAGGSCTVSVNVTSAVAGTHTNVSGPISSSAGGGDTATADLTVDAGRPGLSKIFAPAAVGLGGRSTLTFTVDNTANPAGRINLSFVDNLPSGVVVASPANASTTCTGAAITATPGTGVVALGSVVPLSATVGANSSCTISVDVIGDAAGVRVNTSGELFSNPQNGGANVSSGKATAALTVTAGAVTVVKSFPDDPVGPGGTVTLRLSVFNRDRERTATDVAFTDDLDATLSGLTAISLPPAGACGPGSVVSGTGTVALTGGNLPPEGSCTFDLLLQVPAAAVPGGYPNVTSAVTADLDGVPFIGAPAAETLFVDVAPVLTKTFLTDPVGTGDVATVEFTIVNSSTTSPATDIAFSDSLDAFLNGTTVVAAPAPGFCGAGSILTTATVGGELFLFMFGGNLPASGSCTFTVDLAVPLGAPSGPHLNVTEPITATIEGVTRTGSPASDTLTVAAAPILTKSFTDDPVLPGGTVTLEFTILNPGESAAAVSAIAFTDDLTAVLTGLTAIGLPATDVCGTGSQIDGTTLLTFTGGSLGPDQSCSFSVTLQVPAGALPGGYPNTTSDLTATALGVPVTSGPAFDDLEIAGLSLTKSFTDDPAIPGGTVTLEFTIANASPVSDATGITFTDNLAAVLPGLAAVAPLPATPCGAGSAITGTTSLTFTGGNLAPLTACTFSVTLLVPAATASGTYINVTSPLFATIDGSPTVLDPATDVLEVSSELLALSKTFTDDPVLPGGTVTLEFTVINLDAVRAADGIGFSDDLGAALPGLAAIGLPANNVCGAGSQIDGTGVLTLTGGNLPAGGSCTFQVTLQVPVGAPGGLFTNTTGPVSGTITGLAVTGPSASDDLRVVAITFSKAFAGPAAAGGTATLSFTIENLDTTAGASNLAFFDDLNAVLSGLAAVGLPAADVCGPGSTLAGTSTVTLTGGTLGPSASCTFDVTLQVPPAAAPGSYFNTTSDLSLAGFVVSPPATATLTIEPPPTFAKSFAPATIATTGVSTLTFTIDNTASALAADALDFTDNLPAGVVVATPANAATTCTGGTITAAPGGGTIAYTGGSVAAGASCTVAADVTSGVAGSHVNVSGALTSSSGSSGTATDTLTVEPPPTFAKSFAPATIAIGGVSTLTFTIDNTASAVAATGLDFTDDLPAGVVVATPANPAVTCTGGTLTANPGTGTIAYTGGSVAAGASCTVAADVTSDVEGTYVNVSGDLTSTSGSSGTATDTLTVFDDEIVLTKAFVVNPVLQGGTVLVQYTIAKSSSLFSATAIAYTDDLDAALSGLAAVDTPLADVCGAGSQLTGTSVLSLTGGTLPPNGTCTFQATLVVPPDAPLGTYPSATGVPTAVIDGNPVTAAPASADLEVVFLDFAKSFDPAIVTGGQTTTLTFTIANPDPVNAATAIAFTDDLDAALPGLVAIDTPLADVCGAGSLLDGTSVLALTGGSLAGGGSCTFAVTLQAPGAAEGSFTNLTSTLAAEVGGAPVEGDPAGAAEAVLEVLANVLAIPTLGGWGLLLLAGLIAAAAAWRLRL